MQPLQFLIPKSDLARRGYVGLFDHLIGKFNVPANKQF